MKMEHDIYGIRYYVDESEHTPKFNGISLLRVLNILGDEGWELAIKESKSTYILKRQRK
ncbi:hypothetical protein [Paenibacillus sp. BC26]|uniref:hypothetical protein n=1 Tax=Paenibacillus sp. BC26 TaxID=1881032 RepID=UPI0015A6F131|nr:hypothetical protein [Paenibacillus sp. BC26]